MVTIMSEYACASFFAPLPISVLTAYKQHTRVDMQFVDYILHCSYFSACVLLSERYMNQGSQVGELASALWVSIHWLHSALDSSTTSVPSHSSCKVSLLPSSSLSLLSFTISTAHGKYITHDVPILIDIPSMTDTDVCTYIAIIDISFRALCSETS